MKTSNTKNLAVFAVLAVILVNVSQAHAGGDCKYSREIDKSVDIGSLTLVDVEAAAGLLQITGEQSRRDVQVLATLCASSQELLDTLDVSVALSSGAVAFKTEFPKSSFWRNNDNASIDLTLLVPSSAVLNVQDSSGAAGIENVAKLTMVDSSGRLEVKDIAGDVHVTDSSGELNINNVGGDVNLRDSSGGIYVSQVGGQLVVEVDSSGAIEARKISKDVLIKLDSSGVIDVRDVGGDFTVKKDSSGGVKYERVAGKVNI